MTLLVTFITASNWHFLIARWTFLLWAISSLVIFYSQVNLICVSCLVIDNFLISRWTCEWATWSWIFLDSQVNLWYVSCLLIDISWFPGELVVCELPVNWYFLIPRWTCRVWATWSWIFLDSQVNLWYVSCLLIDISWFPGEPVVCELPGHGRSGQNVGHGVWTPGNDIIQGITSIYAISNKMRTSWWYKQ